MRRRLILYRAMGSLGWAQHEVDAMDVAVCADWLGHGPEGDDWSERTPVIRGSRSLVLPKDDDAPDGGPSPSAARHVQSVTGDDRRAAYKAARGGT